MENESNVELAIALEEGKPYAISPGAKVSEEIVDGVTRYVCESGTLYLGSPGLVGVAATNDSTVVACAPKCIIIVKTKGARGVLIDQSSKCRMEYSTKVSGSSNGVGAASKAQAFAQLIKS